MAGEMVHVEIPVDDTGAGREFWGALFGWEFEAYPGPFEYHMTRLGDQQGAGAHQYGARKAWPARLLRCRRHQRRRREGQGSRW